jgi:dCMP deaminase
MDKQKKWDITFMDNARRLARNSHCASSKKVCCLLVKDGQIISSGINGTLPGLPNCDDIYFKTNGIWNVRMDPTRTRVCEPNEHFEWSKQNEAHAEQNAIAGAARRGISTEGATAYVTHSPCSSCSLLLGMSGIKRLVIGELYDRAPDAFKVLQQKGIEVILITDTEESFKGE